MKKLVFALLSLCISSPAWALNPTGTGWETVCKVAGKAVPLGTPGAKCKKQPKFTVIGLKIDAGAPEGLGFSLVGRPLKFAQLELGGTTTLVGGGIRTGLSVFLPWYISPGATFEYGHQWAGDINKLVVMFGGSDPKISLLNHVEYDYVNLYGTLGFGHPNWFMFRINAGYTYLWANTNGLQTYLQTKTNQPNLTISEASAKVWAPTANVTFQIYFY
jgi:hypothetical protein